MIDLEPAGTRRPEVAAGPVDPKLVTLTLAALLVAILVGGAVTGWCSGWGRRAGPTTAPGSARWCPDGV